MSFLTWFITCLAIGAALGILDALQLILTIRSYND